MTTRIRQEIKAELWERFFIEACSPFKRTDVAKVIEIKSTPFDNDSMIFTGVFQLADNTFGKITAEYSGSWDEVLAAHCYTGKHPGNMVRHTLPHRK